MKHGPKTGNHPNSSVYVPWPDFGCGQRRSGGVLLPILALPGIFALTPSRGDRSGAAVAENRRRPFESHDLLHSQRTGFTPASQNIPPRPGATNSRKKLLSPRYRVRVPGIRLLGFFFALEPPLKNKASIPPPASVMRPPTVTNTPRTPLAPPAS